MDDAITLQLTRPQALVLFEWLAAHAEHGAPATLPFADPAERDVLWAVEAKLEKALPGVLAPDYSSRLAAARRLVRGATDDFFF